MMSESLSGLDAVVALLDRRATAAVRCGMVRCGVARRLAPPPLMNASTLNLRSLHLFILEMLPHHCSCSATVLLANAPRAPNRNTVRHLANGTVLFDTEPYFHYSRGKIINTIAI